MTKRCLVAGHICLDVIPELMGRGDVAAAIQPGRLLETGPVVMATGGAVSNTGQTLHKLGIDTRLRGKVGDDLFGQAIVGLIEGVSPALAAGIQMEPGEASSYTIILSPPNTDRIFFHCPGANDTFSAADIDFEGIGQVDLFHFGYPQMMRRVYENEGAELVEIFKGAKAMGATTSLDTTMPDPNGPSGWADWPAIFRAVLPYVDIFTPSIEEILLMVRPDTFAALARDAATAKTDLVELITPPLVAEVAAELLAMGAKIVLLKASYQGLYLCTADEVTLAKMGRAQPDDLAIWAGRDLWAPAFETAVAGTTGAGDAAIGGLLAALLRGLEPVDALTMANAVGACNVEAPDAVSGIRPWAETLARIETDWPRRELKIDSPDWHFDPAQQVWLGPNDRSYK